MQRLQIALFFCNYMEERSFRMDRDDTTDHFAYKGIATFLGPEQFCL